LPNLPGSVNNFLGGRTYPLSGAAMLLPLQPPFTAPVEVLICGGSTDNHLAIDNCVRIAPEATNPTWTIERMPSKRVLPNMVNLPDGTYLITNGAQHGIAGFAFADTPNFQAVLYDPYAPLYHRFSILNSSTIARMYHSEATLLTDGSVLISGSNPQDPNFPEEYRVERFTPPYINAGLPRPTFTISKTNWAYDAGIKLTVTSGSTSNLHVSLVAASSNTHGNTMGARTIFLAINNCNNQICTIKSPPHAGISPPGWYQLFILKGPTPSLSQWVQIGGDPALLGNWPPGPPFTLPGV